LLRSVEAIFCWSEQASHPSKVPSTQGLSVERSQSHIQQPQRIHSPCIFLPFDEDYWKWSWNITPSIVMFCYLYCQNAITVNMLLLTRNLPARKQLWRQKMLAGNLQRNKHHGRRAFDLISELELHGRLFLNLRLDFVNCFLYTNKVLFLMFTKEKLM